MAIPSEKTPSSIPALHETLGLIHAWLRHVAPIALQDPWPRNLLAEVSTLVDHAQHALWGGNLSMAQAYYAQLAPLVQEMHRAVPERPHSQADNGQPDWDDLMALIRRGQQAIDAAREGGRGRARPCYQEDAEAKATRLWQDIPLLQTSEVARRIRRQWKNEPPKDDKRTIPAERTIRGWIAALAPRRQSSQ